MTFFSTLISLFVTSARSNRCHNKLNLFISLIINRFTMNFSLSVSSMSLPALNMLNAHWKIRPDLNWMKKKEEKKKTNSNKINREQNLSLAHSVHCCAGSAPAQRLAIPEHNITFPRILTWITDLQWFGYIHSIYHYYVANSWAYAHSTHAVAEDRALSTQHRTIHFRLPSYLLFTYM